MLTDWALVRRLGAEIDAELRGARVTDAGSLPDRRVALLTWRRGVSRLLCLDLFASPPAVTLEAGGLGTENEPPFARALARTLRGTSLRAVHPRRGDRVLRFVFGTRSRFGVDDEIDLWVELVPRFGNAILVKGATIVRALKEFSLAENPKRAVLPGNPYVPPPLAGTQPSLPRLLLGGPDAARALAFLESDEALSASLYVYRRGGKLLQAHLLPLPQFGDATLTREPSLHDLLLEDRTAREDFAASANRRRAALERKIERHVRALESAYAHLRAREAEIGKREALRAEGDRIFGTLHELGEAERAEAKERAREAFARYQRLGIEARHLADRERALEIQCQAIESLRWELERGGDAEIGDLEAALAALNPRNARPRLAKRTTRRRPLEFRTASGSRVLVGRSPIENADLTFRVARPRDLWFHARGVPGAHVILSRDDGAEVSSEDVAFAAALAAGHSKARASAKAVVDYTQRKFVRKQRDAPPGVVFYTEARSITVAPNPAPSAPKTEAEDRADAHAASRRRARSRN